MTKYIKEHKIFIQAIGFWTLLIFLAGFSCGLLVSKGIWDYKAREVTKVGAVLIDGKVFDVKQRM